MPKTRHNTTLGDLKEAIEELESLYGENVLELPVYASSDYGDRCHTQQISRMTEIQVHQPMVTAYSDTGMCVTEDTEVCPATLCQSVVEVMAVVLMKRN